MKTILVKSLDHGYFTQSLVTVQRFERIDGDMEVVWCDHAGAQEEKQEVDSFYQDGEYQGQMVSITQCDKCPAWCEVNDSVWNDAPQESL